MNRFQSTWSSWWLAHPNQQDGNGKVLNRKMLVGCAPYKIHKLHLYGNGKKKTVGLLHKRFGIASEVFGITTCLGRLCSCHFSPKGKGGDAME